MNVSEVIVTDNSLLSAVATCSTQTVLRYIFGLTSTEESALLKSGSIGHEVVAMYLRGANRAACLAYFKREYEDWSDENVEPDAGVEYNNLAKILQVWLEKHPRKELPWEIDPDLVEVPFKFALDEHGDFIMTGRMDLLGISKSDRIPEVVDTKFRGQFSGWWASKFRNDSQGSTYITGARSMFPEFGEKITRFYINAIQTKKLPSSTRRCPDHKLPYGECQLAHVEYKRLGPFDRSSQALKDWRRSALLLAKQYKRFRETVLELDEPFIKRLAMEGTFDGSCTFCFAKPWCDADRQVRLIKSMFVRDEWQPNPDDPAARLVYRDHRTGSVGAVR